MPWLIIILAKIRPRSFRDILTPEIVLYSGSEGSWVHSDKNLKNTFCGKTVAQGTVYTNVSNDEKRGY